MPAYLLHCCCIFTTLLGLSSLPTPSGREEDMASLSATGWQDPKQREDSSKSKLPLAGRQDGTGRGTDLKALSPQTWLPYHASSSSLYTYLPACCTVACLPKQTDISTTAFLK